MRRQMALVLVAIASMARIARADWKAPADGTFTEDELKNYIAASNDWIDENFKIADAVAKASTVEGRIAAVADIDKKKSACIQRHHLTDSEYEYVQGKSIQAWGTVLIIDESYTKSEADTQAKQNDQDQQLADAQKKLEIYQAAQKDGKRVMSQEDRDVAIKSAKDDQATAADEIKTHQDEIKTARDEIKTHQADAKAADDLAKNPPANVVAEDRDDYISGKKSDAQAAREAMKDSQSRDDDATKALAVAKARSDADATMILHPDVPQTDDDKALVKSENDGTITRAQADIGNIKQGKEGLAIAEAAWKKQTDDMKSKIPTANLELMRKHMDEYKAMLNHMGHPNGSMQP